MQAQGPTIAGAIKHELQAGSHAVKDAERAIMPSWFTSRLACTGGFSADHKAKAASAGKQHTQAQLSSRLCTHGPAHVPDC